MLKDRAVDVWMFFSHDDGLLLVHHQLVERRRSAVITTTGIRRTRTLTCNTTIARHNDELHEALVC